jgi:hypothetical protein
MRRVCFLLTVKAREHRRQEEMARYFDGPDGAPDDGIAPLTEVSHLD